MRPYLIVLIAFCLVVRVAPCPGKEPRPFLIVAEEYPPYEYVKSGKPCGINVDVIEHIFTKLNIPYEIRFYPWTRAWLMMEKGRADAVLSVSHKADREPYLYYTPEQKMFTENGTICGDYLWITEYVFFINRKFEKALKFNSYEQIKRDRYRVGITTGYSYQPSFFKAGLNTFSQVNKEDSFRDLVAGKIDVFPKDKAIGQSTVHELGLADQITYLPKPLFLKPYLLGFGRKSKYPGMEQLMRRFYDELRTLRSSGAYREIVDQHAQKIPRRSAERPLTFVCEEWRPFEYMHNDQPAGLDVEVVGRIMKRLKIPYEIKIYPWSRAWMMAQKGDADAVLTMSYKPSREEFVYYTDGQRAISENGKLPQDYLWLSEFVFFIKKKNADRLRFESYQQIIQDGYTIGLNKDYSYNEDFMGHAALMKSETYYDTKSGFAGLIEDEIDLYPMDKTVGLAELQNMGLEDSVVYLPKQLFSKPYLVPFARNSDYPDLEAVMYDVYHELRDMRASGEYQALYDQFIFSLLKKPVNAVTPEPELEPASPAETATSE